MTTVLCIDDEPMILKVIAFKLKKDGYNVITAIDGQDGINKIETETPDLIITDILMPQISGLEVINHVRNVLKMQTPIIVMSALHDEKDVLLAFEIGADDYVKKPLMPNELSVRCSNLLKRKNI